MSAVDVVDAYLAGLPGPARRLAYAEWGLSIEDEHLGGALDVGVRIADELLRAQALALGADPDLDLRLLLHWNRQTRLVRFGSSRAGDVWVHADVPVLGLDERGVDRLLGLVVQAAARAREYAAAVSDPAPNERTWLSRAARPPAGD